MASFYPEWAGIGGGLGNYMAYGDLPQNGIGDVGKLPLPARRHPRTRTSPRSCRWIRPTPRRSPRRSRTPGTTYPAGKTALHPWEGVTEPNYTGPKPPYKQLDENGQYSWLKAPRWKGNAMEVGPLARMLVGYAARPHRVQGGGQRGAGPAEGSRRRRCSRRWAAPRRAGSRPRLAVHWLMEEYERLVANLKAGDTATADTSKWDPVDLARRGQGLRLHRGARAARWATGSTSRTARSPTTRRRALHLERLAEGRARGSTAPTRPRCSARRWPIPSGRWRSCAPSTPSTRAWPAPRT